MGETEEDSNNDKMIIDNVLCYVSSARHSMKNDDIVQVCLAFYKLEDIIKGKDLHYGIVGEKPKRRRHENKCLSEIKDILEMLCKCDENGKILPRFVVDKHDGLPPTSGFDLVANSIIGLMQEIGILKRIKSNF